MPDYHTKDFFVNASITKIVSSTGTSVLTVPSFNYKDQLLLRFTITDSTGAAVNLSGGSFEFKIVSSYSTQNTLVTSANSKFVSGDWGSWSTSGGKICCRVDMNQAAVLTYIDNVKSKVGYCGLWATIGGVNYLLAQFNCNVANIIS